MTLGSQSDTLNTKTYYIQFTELFRAKIQPWFLQNLILEQLINLASPRVSLLQNHLIPVVQNGFENARDYNIVVLSPDSGSQFQVIA
jgi:hypothetical protein